MRPSYPTGIAAALLALAMSLPSAPSVRAAREPIALPKSIGAFQMERSRPRMYVNAKEAGQVVVIDTDKDEVIARFPVAPAGVPAAMAIDEPNRRLFVGCRREPSLVVMDSD